MIDKEIYTEIFKYVEDYSVIESEEDQEYRSQRQRKQKANKGVNLLSEGEKKSIQINVVKNEKNGEDESYDIVNSPIKIKKIMKQRHEEEYTVGNLNESEQEEDDSYAEIGESNEIVSDINEKVLNYSIIKLKKMMKQRHEEEYTVGNLNESEQDEEDSYAEIGESNEIGSDTINEKVINYSPIKTKKIIKQRLKEENTVGNLNESEQDEEDSYAEIGESNEIGSDTINEKVINYSPIKTKKIIKQRPKEENTVGNLNESEQDEEDSYAEIGESNEIASDTINEKVINYSPIKTKKIIKQRPKEENTVGNLNESEQDEEDSYAEIGESNEIVSDTINEKVINYSHGDGYLKQEIINEQTLMGDYVKCSLGDDVNEEDIMKSYEHVNTTTSPSVSSENIGEESFDIVMLSQKLLEAHERVTGKYDGDDDDDEEFMIVAPELAFQKKVIDLEGGSALKTMPLSDLKIIREESSFSEENNTVSLMSRSDVKDLLQRFDEDNCKKTQILVREMRESNESLVRHFQEAITNACKEINVSVKGIKEPKTELTGYVGLLHEQIMKDNQEMKNMIAGLINCSCSESLKLDRARQRIVETKPNTKYLVGPEENNTNDEVVIDNETRNANINEEFKQLMSNGLPANNKQVNGNHISQNEEFDSEYYNENHPNFYKGRTNKEVICIIEKSNGDIKPIRVDCMEDIAEVSEIENSLDESNKQLTNDHELKNDSDDIQSDHVKIITHTERMKRRCKKKKEDIYPENTLQDGYKSNSSDQIDVEQNNNEEQQNIWEKVNTTLKKGMEEQNNSINTRNDEKVDSPKGGTKTPAKSNAGNPGIPKKTIKLVSEKGKEVGPKLKETLDANVKKAKTISDEKVRDASKKEEELRQKLKEMLNANVTEATTIPDGKLRRASEKGQGIRSKMKDTLKTEKANVTPMIDEKVSDAKEKEEEFMRKVKGTVNTEKGNHAKTILDKKISDVNEEKDSLRSTLKGTWDTEVTNATAITDGKVHSVRDQGQEVTSKLKETLNGEKFNPTRIIDAQKDENDLIDPIKNGVNKLTSEKEVMEPPNVLGDPNIEEDNWKVGMENMKKTLKNDYFKF